MIEDSLRCYHSLIYASQIIDECYGPIMLVVFGSCFALIGHAAVGLMQTSMQVKPVDLLIQQSRMIPILTLLVPLPLYVAHKCEKTANQVNSLDDTYMEL